MGDTIDVIIRIILTVLLSSVIGFEREIRNKGAGMRTHILVAVGACLIVLTSFYVFDIFKSVTIIDPTRMITGVVTGIGFLCAGTIIRAGNQISGLTTAATLWIVACVGMAIGAGHYSGGIIVTAVVFLVLVFVRTFEKRIKSK